MANAFDTLATLPADRAHEKRQQRGDTTRSDHTEPTEDAAALAFAEENVGLIVFDHTAGEWRTWRDGRWAADTRKSVFNSARVFTRALRARLNDPPMAMAKIAFAAHVENAARADPRLAVSHEVWDTDPWLLGVPGGVVDLRTGNLLDADPALYITRQATVRPAPPGTDAPLWRAFIKSSTGGDDELSAFLQRLSGYIMTGNVTEEVLAFLYGPGGNGKGVFLGGLAAILGEYAVSVPIDVFTAGSRINVEYYRAQMAGARLVMASETEAQATWAESQIKEMTGNEAPLSARHPYGKPFTFWPQFKIVLVGNHAPKLKGRSPAMERRLRVLPFTHTPATPDPGLKARLRDEYPAILRWMIDGCLWCCRR
jgi:putative DNA primase/helicase